ncbi:MAG: methylenetetrahydrofolate reductase [Proteobacteria bacterium]|nr:methylenetetrahydrofolate reductase [Pseudomonadota bacterium]
MEKLFADKDRFIVTVEVVPPAGPDAGPLLSELNSLKDLSFDGFSVATNPVAKARMSAMAMCKLIQSELARTAILHCTIRDHNRIAVQGEFWGAKALGLKTVMVATGDNVALKDRGLVSRVGDVNVCDLITMAREAGLFTGVVLDTKPELSGGFERAVRRLEEKAKAGAQYAVTQPVYDEQGARAIADAVKHIGIPVILGILPLRTFKHAEFLHTKVSGIAVPDQVRKRMETAKDPVAEGAKNAREVFEIAKDLFKGACVMPPFDHFEVLFDILK